MGMKETMSHYWKLYQVEKEEHKETKRELEKLRHDYKRVLENKSEIFVKLTKLEGKYELLKALALPPLVEYYDRMLWVTDGSENRTKSIRNFKESI